MSKVVPSKRGPYRNPWIPTNPPSFRLQERDRELIEIVFQLRYATSDQIADLYLLEHADKGHSRNGVKYRLYVLFHGGYLSRPKEARILMLFAGKGLPYIYGIGQKSYSLLRQKGYDEEQIKAATNEPNYRYLEHALMVSQFHTNLLKALKERSDLQLLFWKNEGAQTRRFWGGGDDRRSVNPDAYFALQDDRGPMYFLAEMDRGTMSNRRLRLKIKSYLEFWQEKRHWEEPFSIPRGKDFKVLFVAETLQRKEVLRAMTKSIAPQGHGSKLFWFSLAAQLSAKSFFDPNWQLADLEGVYPMLWRGEG